MSGRELARQRRLADLAGPQEGDDRELSKEAEHALPVVPPGDHDLTLPGNMCPCRSDFMDGVKGSRPNPYLRAWALPW